MPKNSNTTAGGGDEKNDVDKLPAEDAEAGDCSTVAVV
jgi:hypothetical protein